MANPFLFRGIDLPIFPKSRQWRQDFLPHPIPNERDGARARVEGDGMSTHRDYRVGNGFDVHRLVEGRPCVLGGVHSHSLS